MMKLTLAGPTLAALALTFTLASCTLLAQTPAKPANPAPDPSSFYSSFYPGGKETSKDFVQAISVSAPAYCSEIKGDVTVTFKAPGMTQVKAYCWQQPTKDKTSPWGHDVDLAPNLKLDADSNGSFVFHADQFPGGPINLRIYAKDSGDHQDYCEIQLYNKGGVVWNLGAPKTAPPAAKDMKLAFCDDFDGPLSISGTDDSARYWTHWSGGDGSAWPFSENEGPNNPFSRVGTFLRIHASKPEGTKGTTGSITPVHKSSSKPGITVKAPCYLECRFLAQNVTGIWPAFWVTTQSKDPKVGCDELDVLEAYGTSAKSHEGIWSAYWARTHFWGKPTPPWAEEKGPDGKLLRPSNVRVETMELGGKSSWSTTFHTYGLLVTKTDTVYYFDDIEVLRHPSGENSKILPMSVIANLALSGGWPVDLQRYGNQSDMWIDYVRLYQGE